MNGKIESLIQAFANVHSKISKMYKNLESIEGQYNPKIKTIAKILWMQTENKIKVYNTMLMDAANLEMEITEEGYQAALQMTKDCEEALKKNMSLGDLDIIGIAIEFSKIKVDLFRNVLALLNRFESEKNIVHKELKEKVTLIIHLEERDSEILETYRGH